jgi:ADP-heptose:LPS heptosyltransferase
VRRIAVVRPNHRLGNAVLLTPLVRELEARFPESCIELITTGSAAQSVFREFRAVTAIHAFPRRSYRDPFGVLRMLLKLQPRSYDLAIDPITRSRSGRFILGCLRARERIGFRWDNYLRDRMLTYAVDPAGVPVHFAQTPLFLLEHDRHPVQTMTVESRRVDLRLTPAERRAGAERLGGLGVGPHRTCLGIFANATGDKCFPPDWWRRVLLGLRRHRSDLAAVEFVPADGRPRLDGEVPALYTPDLRLLAATMSATSALLTGDCGIMHLADAAGARVVGLFRTSEPSRYGPSGPDSAALWARNDCPDDVALRLAKLLEMPPAHSDRRRRAQC